MAVYVAKRLLVSIISLFVLVSIIFFVLRILPGDVTEVLLGEEGYTEARADALRKELGLDVPIPQQYVRWLENLAVFDLGNSLTNGRAVNYELRIRFVRSAELAFLAMFVGSSIGVVLGVLSATRRDSAVDFFVGILATLGISVPSFVIGVVLVFIVSIQLGWLPSAGFEALREDPSMHLRHLLLPALTLAASPMAIAARMTRSSMLEVLGQDFVRTARAKGLRENAVVYRHGLRNAAIPIVTQLGLSMGGLMAGTVIVETIFAWPGLGMYMIEGVTRRDLPVAEGTIIAVGAIYIFINLSIDLIYGLIDPRIRYS
jgi:peptide/nickel transport system permease protein